MPRPVRKARYQKRFSSIEASFRVEGMDPGDDAIYRRAQAMVLSGEMTPKQALEYVIEQSSARRRAIA